MYYFLWFFDEVVWCVLLPTKATAKYPLMLVSGLHIFFCELNSLDLIFFVQGGYMTLGSTFPAPINRFWYPVNLIIRLIIHCFPCLSLSVSLSLSWPLRRETLPVPSLWLCWYPVCQSQVPPWASPPWASKWLHHLRPVLWPHPFFWPQGGSWEDGQRWHLCPTRCPA